MAGALLAVAADDSWQLNARAPPPLWRACLGPQAIGLGLNSKSAIILTVMRPVDHAAAGRVAVPRSANSANARTQRREAMLMERFALKLLRGARDQVLDGVGGSAWDLAAEMLQGAGAADRLWLLGPMVQGCE